LETAGHADVRGVGPSPCDQRFSRRVKVIEDVLFALEHAVPVPAFPVLAAAAKVG
jgi:hypothetical protein